MVSLPFVILLLNIITQTSPQSPHPDPCCTTGIQSDNICCLKSCGTCGGDECDGFIGGESNCCPEKIKQQSISCNTVGPPCIITINCPILSRSDLIPADSMSKMRSPLYNDVNTPVNWGDIYQNAINNHVNPVAVADSNLDIDPGRYNKYGNYDPNQYNNNQINPNVNNEEAGPGDKGRAYNEGPDSEDGGMEHFPHHMPYIQNGRAVLIEVTACEGWHYASVANSLQLQLKGEYDSTRFFFVNRYTTLPTFGESYVYYVNIDYYDMYGNLIAVLISMDDKFGYCLKGLSIIVLPYFDYDSNKIFDQSDFTGSLGTFDLLFPHLVNRTGEDPTTTEDPGGYFEEVGGRYDFYHDYFGLGVFFSKECKYSFVSFTPNRIMAMCYDDFFDMYVHSGKAIYKVVPHTCMHPQSGIQVLDMVGNVYHTVMGKVEAENYYIATDFVYMDHFQVGMIDLHELGHIVAGNVMIDKFANHENGYILETYPYDYAFYSRNIQGKIIGIKLEAIGYMPNNQMFFHEQDTMYFNIRIDGYDRYVHSVGVLGFGQYFVAFLDSVDRIYVKKSTQIIIYGEFVNRLQLNVFVIFDGFNEYYHLPWVVEEHYEEKPSPTPKPTASPTPKPTKNPTTPWPTKPPPTKKGFKWPTMSPTPAPIPTIPPPTSEPTPSPIPPPTPSPSPKPTPAPSPPPTPPTYKHPSKRPTRTTTAYERRYQNKGQMGRRLLGEFDDRFMGQNLNDEQNALGGQSGGNDKYSGNDKYDYNKAYDPDKYSTNNNNYNKNDNNYNNNDNNYNKNDDNKHDKYDGKRMDYKWDHDSTDKDYTEEGEEYEEDGYKRFNGLGWFEANGYCDAKYGTYLASVHSADEEFLMNGFIGTYDSDRAWIGLFDFDINNPNGCHYYYGSFNGMNNDQGGFYRYNCDWKWIDRSYVDFTDWASNSPNRISGEDCAFIDGKYRRGWENIACETTDWVTKYVCLTGFWYPNQIRKFDHNTDQNIKSNPDTVIITSMGNDNPVIPMCIDSISTDALVQIDITVNWIGGGLENPYLNCIYKVPICKTEVIRMEVDYSTSRSKHAPNFVGIPNIICINEGGIGQMAECYVDQFYGITAETKFRLGDHYDGLQYVSWAAASRVTLSTVQSSSFKTTNLLFFKKKYVVWYVDNMANGTYQRNNWKQVILKPENVFTTIYEDVFYEDFGGYNTSFYTTQNWQKRSPIPIHCLGEAYIPPAHMLPYNLNIDILHQTVNARVDLKCTLCDQFLNEAAYNDDIAVIYLNDVPAQLRHWEPVSCAVQWMAAEYIGKHVTCNEEQELAIQLRLNYLPMCQKSNPDLYDGCQCNLGRYVCWCVDEKGNKLAGQATQIPTGITYNEVCVKTLNCSNSDVTLV